MYTYFRSKEEDNFLKTYGNIGTKRSIIQYPALLPFVENLRSMSINNETKSKDLDKPFLGTIQIPFRTLGDITFL